VIEEIVLGEGDRRAVARYMHIFWIRKTPSFVDIESSRIVRIVECLVSCKGSNRKENMLRGIARKNVISSSQKHLRWVYLDGCPECSLSIFQIKDYQ